MEFIKGTCDFLGTWHAAGSHAETDYDVSCSSMGQQKFEANFRFALVRVREHAEGIALYLGEAG